jgi:hypothetical protein
VITAVYLPVSVPWERIRRRVLLAGVIGLAICALSAVASPTHALRGYLVAFNYWLGIALGSLALLMLQHLTGGVWGLVLRRVFEAATRTIGLLALLFIPLLLGLPRLYIWVNSTDPELVEKSWYLNVPFFLGRAAAYFLIWLMIAFFLNKWSAPQDHGPFPERRFRLLSGPGLAIYGATITFASIDWVMSLEPHWSSTIFPVIYAVGQILEAIAFSIAVLISIGSQPAFEKLLGPAQRRDLGNLLLTFVMMWAYLSFSQFLLIWAGNLPEEIPWYLRRTRGGWQVLALVLVVFQFSLPFVLLLTRRIKEDPRSLAVVAVLILGMRYLDLYWWIQPAFEEGVSFYFLVDVAALIGLGGIWIWYFLGQLGKLPLLPMQFQGQGGGSGHE